MNIREQSEKLERETLSSKAMLSSESKGREREDKKCDIRTEFQRDRDRITHSKAFRRLKHKTQVFLSPEGDHYRTRLTHTLEVSQISRTIARALLLNEDLTEAIALGHDLGHTPFGHTGERVLKKLNKKGFHHNEQSLRIVTFLENRKGNEKGLNLTYEVRDGILNHTGENTPITIEGQIVKICDRIAYINHDIDDAIRGKILKEEDLPKDCIKVLGSTHGQRINNMIIDIIENSKNNQNIIMSEEMDHYTKKLRKFMFEKVYFNKKAKKEEGKAEYIIEQLYNYYIENYNKISIEFRKNPGDKYDIISDYIAGMTDRYAIKKFNNIFVPSPWQK
ncbi:deoxyguanosinetriphosphate triphosphohydrolase [Clostridium sp. D2Q-11]|uniref:Deoxyguanosinetriphosphate triphosphohydrolase-like protein n=1 Tax=Anaeromonas frigoriresistens TaxID=2683708 RepID=A0A942UUB1_9FIRM|nr:deoxyguanosinetriphosphate triphosphohydrolase [Anaeromonas frigoriresistens]MBS4536914.1 deoxyguanosinetriphosphate triphosphohydrolase [Anaeromonas frigoriresistens]